jgi:endogenous inhibitor of DNA gyrase (YacG/DUF329 family)
MIRVSCPICEQRMAGESLKDLPYFPFCSRRCKLIDLGRWLDGTYQLASDEEDSTSQEKDVP